jgi:hypothetical protein
VTALFPSVDPAAGGFIRSYCRWHIAPVVTETVSVVGSGGAVVLLPTLLLLDVTAVSVNSSAVLLTDVSWTPAGALYRAAGWGSGALIVATIEHGYAECPPEVEDVANRLKKSAGAPAGATIRVGEVSISGGAPGGDGLDAYCKGVLDRYRRPL